MISVSITTKNKNTGSKGSPRQSNLSEYEVKFKSQGFMTFFSIEGEGSHSKESSSKNADEYESVVHIGLERTDLKKIVLKAIQSNLLQLSDFEPLFNIRTQLSEVEANLEQAQAKLKSAKDQYDKNDKDIHRTEILKEAWENSAKKS